MKRGGRLLAGLAAAIVWGLAYYAAGFLAIGTATELRWDPVRFVPVVNAFVFPYLSTYALPLVVYATVRDPVVFRRFALAVCFAAVVSAAGFVLWPLMIARPPVVGEGNAARVLGWLYAVDRPANLFPSLHVSTSFLFAAVVSRTHPKWTALLYLWAAAIAVSTLFIRQHYLIDVLGGLAVAWICWILFRILNGSKADGR